jgi:hypothetical protein
VPYDPFMRLLLSCVLLVLSFSALAGTQGQQCFTSHLRDSISINKERRNAYADLTQGHSDRVFNSLLLGEYLTLLPARFLDFYARKYHRAGINLFCDEFKDMKDDLAPPSLGPIPYEEWVDFDWRRYKKSLKEALIKKDIDSVKLLSLNALEELKKYPHYYCMMRHLIESIYRFAHFTPLRMEEAKGAGLPSPEKLMFKVMRLHLLALGSSFQIDVDSYPIQASGIPILCTELPNLMSDL